MADWALVIGINKYSRLRSLDYAERDAALMRDFFQNEPGFEQIFYFSDTSPDFYAPDGSSQSTRPTYANLRSFLRDFFEETQLQAKEKSYEIEEIGQGAFTYALLESLRIQGEGNCATVERLYQRLRYRVAEINHDYNKPEQTPYAIVEPASKYHLILLPRQATLQDIAELKMDAFKAEVEGNYELAKQLWIRVNAAAAGSDIDVIQAFQRIFQRQGQPTPPTQPEPVTTQSGAKSQTTPLKTTEPEVELLSEKNVNYARLRYLLANGKWEEADKETFAVMLQAAGREQEVWLDSKSIETFPCTDLRTIDRLWVKYSDGRFGFSVQKRIWESVGGKPGKNDFLIYDEFCNRVGWCLQGEWLKYSEISFSLNATKGHLPGGQGWCQGLCVGGEGWLDVRRIGYLWWSLFSRLDL